jgi:hypothetical protein
VADCQPERGNLSGKPLADDGEATGNAAARIADVVCVAAGNSDDLHVLLLENVECDFEDRQDDPDDDDDSHRSLLAASEGFHDPAEAGDAASVLCCRLERGEAAGAGFEPVLGVKDVHACLLSWVELKSPRGLSCGCTQGCAG